MDIWGYLYLFISLISYHITNPWINLYQTSHIIHFDTQWKPVGNLPVNCINESNIEWLNCINIQWINSFFIPCNTNAQLRNIRVWCFTRELQTHGSNTGRRYYTTIALVRYYLGESWGMLSPILFLDDQNCISGNV